MAGSLAVLSDAAHLAADLSAFVVAICGSHIASLPASDSHTFGLKRTESLAALLSMVSLAILSMGLAVEAIRRMWVLFYVGEETTEVDGKLMSTIAFIGVIVNVVLAYVLGEDHVHMVGSDDCGHGHDHGHSHSHHDKNENHKEHDHGHSHSLHNENESHNGHDHGHNHSHHNENENHDSHDHGHSHSHNENENDNGHSHSHNDHDEESDPLLTSSSNKEHAYSTVAVNEVQHLDEVLPECSADKDDEHKSHGKPRNVNLHAAYLHVLADLTQSVVVLVAGLIIWAKPTWQLADPICTLIFSILVCYATVGVIRSSLSVLLEEVPPGVNWEEVYDAISAVKGVSNVHDLHIWSISHGNFILSVHATAENTEQAYSDIKDVCNRRNISHLTVQLQPSSVQDCVTCTEGSIHQCR